MGRRAGTIGLQTWLLLHSLGNPIQIDCSPCMFVFGYGQSSVGPPSMVSVDRAIHYLGYCGVRWLLGTILLLLSELYAVHCSNVDYQNIVGQLVGFHVCQGTQLAY